MRERELCDAATANFVTHASWAARGRPGARVESNASLTLVDSGLGADTFNLVCGARLRPDEVAESGERVLRHFDSVGRPFSWWVAPGDAPDDLAKRLAGAGLQERETELAMALDLSTSDRRPPGPEGVEIREATTLDGRRGLRQDQRGELEPARSRPSRSSTARQPRGCSRRTAPRSSSSRVATESPSPRSSSRSSEGVGGIYNLSTGIDHRRRGIGGALIDRACRRAADPGLGDRRPAGVGGRGEPVSVPRLSRVRTDSRSSSLPGRSVR